MLPLPRSGPVCAAQTGRYRIGGASCRASAASQPISSGSTNWCYHACILLLLDEVGPGRISCSLHLDLLLWCSPSIPDLRGTAFSSGTRKGAGATAKNPAWQRHPIRLERIIE